MDNNGNELAYPRLVSTYEQRDGFEQVHESQGGLTKREELAARMMQGLLANPGGPVQANMHLARSQP